MVDRYAAWARGIQNPCLQAFFLAAAFTAYFAAVFIIPASVVGALLAWSVVFGIWCVAIMVPLILAVSFRSVYQEVREGGSDGSDGPLPMPGVRRVERP
jgi:hypothetical protein